MRQLSVDFQATGNWASEGNDDQPNALLLNSIEKNNDKRSSAPHMAALFKCRTDLNFVQEISDKCNKVSGAALRTTLLSAREAKAWNTLCVSLIMEVNS